MISRRIDLTENWDFSGGGEIFMDTPIEIPIDEFHLMTPEQYDKLMWWESIFGRSRHYTQKSEVFDAAGKYEEKWKYHCARCGDELRMPWQNFGGVCEKCNRILEQDKKLPWKNKFESWDNTAYNLFNSR